MLCELPLSTKVLSKLSGPSISIITLSDSSILTILLSFLDLSLWDLYYDCPACVCVRSICCSPSSWTRWASSSPWSSSTGTSGARAPTLCPTGYGLFSSRKRRHLRPSLLIFYYLFCTTIENAKNETCFELILIFCGIQISKGVIKNCFPQNPEIIEGFIEDQAFTPSQDLAPPTPPSPLSSVSSTGDTLRKRYNLLTEEGVRGLGRSQIIRRRDSLVLYKSFNTLW
jgi:hypothetical protein